LNLLAASARPGEGAGMTYIVIHQSYAYLETELRHVFPAASGDVHVIVDRRYGERRTSSPPAAVERRRAERRRPKEAVADVVIVQRTADARPS
jgi:hypothetical protein